MKNPDDLAGGPVVSRKSGDLSIGRDLAARNRLDRLLSPGLEFHFQKNLSPLSKANKGKRKILFALLLFIFYLNHPQRACPSWYIRQEVHKH